MNARTGDRSSVNRATKGDQLLRLAVVWGLRGAILAAPLVASSGPPATSVNDAPGVIVVEVHDARTQHPLQCAAAILSRTKWGGHSDSTGTIRLVYPKIGAEQLMIRQIGYRDTVFAVTFGNALPETLRCELTQSWARVPTCDEFVQPGCIQFDPPPEMPLFENVADTAVTNLRVIPDTAHVFRSRPK